MSVPVVIVGGFLGAGKTTLLTRLLAAPEGRRLAVIVNDFGDLNIDAALVKEVSGDTLELTNGCLCCSARGDLLIAARRLMEREPRPDGVVIEASGVARPDNVARSLTGSEFNNHFEVRTILTLIDAAAFSDLDFEPGELAIDQAAVADLVILNKVDLVGEERQLEVKRVLKEAAPHIRLIETVKAEVPTDLIFDESLVRSIETQRSVSPADDMFESFTWTSNVPLDLRAFRDALELMPSEVYRLKGFIWTGDRPDEWLLVQQVGRRGTIEPFGSLPEAPRSELVVIARKGCMSEAEIASRFETCTLEKRNVS